MTEDVEMLRVGSYCQVFVNHRTDSLNPLAFNKPAWLEGVVVRPGAKRTRVDLGKKEIQKRNRFVRPV